MLSHRCLFCDHENPPDARFCNDCGSPVDMQACNACGAINKRTSSHCYKCGGALTSTVEPDFGLTSADASVDTPSPMATQDQRAWMLDDHGIEAGRLAIPESAANKLGAPSCVRHEVTVAAAAEPALAAMPADLARTPTGSATATWHPSGRITADEVTLIKGSRRVWLFASACLLVAALAVLAYQLDDRREPAAARQDTGPSVTATEPVARPVASSEALAALTATGQASVNGRAGADSERSPASGSDATRVQKVDCPAPVVALGLCSEIKPAGGK
jgi:ribosomal protein L40E